MIEDFFHFPLVSTTPGVHLELQISLQIFKKFKMALMVLCRFRFSLVNLRQRIAKICFLPPLDVTRRTQKNLQGEGTTDVGSRRKMLA
jgi:hypothetical protein